MSAILSPHDLKLLPLVKDCTTECQILVLQQSVWPTKHHLPFLPHPKKRHGLHGAAGGRNQNLECGSLRTSKERRETILLKKQETECLLARTKIFFKISAIREIRGCFFFTF
jgi:hypothetical protein